jgi:hypothetical protein
MESGYPKKAVCKRDSFFRQAVLVVRPPGIDVLALAPGTLERAFFPPQRMVVGVTGFGVEELVDV